jgi:putative long chain acyl-CoA synthase
VSVVFYTGALLGALVNAPESPAERGHPLRLFAGSGMPSGIWRRLVERFSPARVVEFFASTEGNAVLVNLTGEKIGSVGRPLPGGAELAVAAWDLKHGGLVEHPSGFTKRSPDGGIGLLLSRVDRARGEVEGRPLRGVFEAGDAWISTGDLVHRDDDGDYWLIDHVGDVIHGRDGLVPTLPVEDTLSAGLDFVDLAAVYGVALPGQEAEIPVAAITLRAGHVLDTRALRRTVDEHLPESHRPVVVRVLEELPMTSGHRVRKRPLRAAGLVTTAGRSFWRAPDADVYLPLRGEGPDQLLASVQR